jgi:predicted HTH domain antitoxin
MGLMAWRVAGGGKSLIADFAYNAYVKALKEIPLSTRVPMQVWSQLEQFMREEKLDKSAAVRKLLWIGLEGWRQKRALEALAEGNVTFMKAAEIAGLDVWDFAELVKRSEMVWVKPSQRRLEQDIRAAMAEQ